ncbi:hypothetical protein Tco_1556858 [Tanacetum coccineum]
MGDEHLSTILKTESDELIKSSVENLVPIPSESKDLSKDLSDIESKCNVPVCDDFTTFSNPLFDADNDFSSCDDESFSDDDVPKENFKIYSNPLFDEEIISSKIDPHHFNAESDFIESLLNRDILTVSYPKIDYLLEELSGELTHIILIPPGIKEADFDPEEEICLIEELLYDNSSPRPPEESNSKISNAIIESFSPSPILVEDSDSLMEEIDLFINPDDSIPSGIESDDYDSDGDILFLEELLNNDSLSLPESESFHFNHYDVPSSPRPPAKPPDDGIFFDFEPDTGVLTTKVVEDISEHYWQSNISSEPDTLTSDLTSPEVNDDIFDPEGDIVLIEKLLNLDSTKDLPPSHNINLLSGSTTSSSPSLTTSEISDYSLEEFADELALIESFPSGNDDMTPEDVIREIEYLLNRDPLAKNSPNNDLIYTIPEMFTDEHTLDYSSPPRYDDADDDLFYLKTDNDEWGKILYDDPFDSKENKKSF